MNKNILPYNRKKFPFLFIILILSISTTLIFCSQKKPSPQLQITKLIHSPLKLDVCFQKHLDSLRLKKMELIIDGKRSCASIDSFIDQNLSKLRYAYNNRLHLRPNLIGWIGLQFIITGKGNVVRCTISESSIQDEPLHDSLRSIVDNWHFSPLENITDLTQVYFPFCCGSFCGSYTIINCNGVLTKTRQR
jgi:hypothetical protein